MKKLVVPALLAVLALSGCASPTAEPKSSPTPSWTPDPNSAACVNFAALTMSIPSKVNNSTGPAKDMWEAVRVSFDEVALTAQGTVKDRMLAMVDHWPDLLPIMTGQYDDINGKITAVQRACQAEGVTATFGTLTSK
ncbi:hypothetical protein [Microbacterium sp. 22242]|uniref:hypothetical protein n=1 Tax=Microbacterium sp. 22242 TaxID=3453896 RepID=UPI003F85C1A0